jgi:hypothetical protein
MPSILSLYIALCSNWNSCSPERNVTFYDNNLGDYKAERLFAAGLSTFFLNQVQKFFQIGPDGYNQNNQNSRQSLQSRMG